MGVIKSLFLVATFVCGLIQEATSEHKSQMRPALQDLSMDRDATEHQSIQVTVCNP